MKRSLLLACILGFIGFVTSFGAHIVAVNLPFYAEKFGMGLVIIGLLIAAYDFAEIIAKPIFGVLADKQGMKRTMLMGIALFTFASLAYLFVPPQMLILIRFLQGIGAAALSAVSLALVGVYYKENRGRAFGVYNAIKGAGYVISPLVGGSIIARSNFAAIFVATAGIGAISFLLALFLPRANAEGKGVMDDDDDFSFAGFFASFKEPALVPWYVITVVKQREGWDCPFAYVLGSVGNVATETAVEQLLGRILRMPQATPTGVPELDRAYAIVQSEDVAKTAANLADSMVNRCGFDRVTVADVLRVHRRMDDTPSLPFTAIPVSAPPNLSKLTPEVKAKVSYEPDTKTITVHQPLTRDDAQALRDVLPAAGDKAAVETFWQEEREVGTVPKKLDEYAPPIRVPQLAVLDGQQLLRFEPIELDEFEWNLKGCEAKFAEAEFSADLHIGDHVLVDVTGKGAVRVGGVEEVIVRQQSLFIADDHWEKAELVRWFDKELHRGGQNAGLTAAESQAWLNRLADDLIAERSIPIPILVRKRHELADLIYHRIVDHGRQQVRKVAETLFGSEGQRRLETTFDMPFDLKEQDYAPYRRYIKGPFTFLKHAFDLMGELGHEESQCAKKLDDDPNVKRWIRNLVHESAGGFSLPLSPGRFFPDFLAELKDGRIAIVEYKGKHLAKVPEQLHKKDVGEMWEARSGGKCVFAWVVDMDWATLEARLKAIPLQ